MKQPPRLLGFAHGTFILAFFSYFILACVPTSEYQDPASGSEIPEQAVIDTINNAAAPEGPLENAYNLNDSALFTLYIKLYSQVQPRAHIDTRVYFKDNCRARFYETVSETNETSQYEVRFDKPECKNNTESVASSQAIENLRRENSLLVQAMRSEFPSLQLASDDEGPPHYYGLTVVKYQRQIPNCSQYPGCVTDFVRVEFDDIRNPNDENRRQRYHHVYEISVKVPRIVVLFNHCVSYIYTDQDGKKLPITTCKEVTDFLAGQPVN